MNKGVSSKGAYAPDNLKQEGHMPPSRYFHDEF